MIAKNKIITNASWIIFCKVIQSVLTLVISMITARYLGPSNYGIISYASSIAAFVYPISSLGLNHILVQETVQRPEEEGKIYGTSLVLSLASSLACIAGVGAFVSVVNATEIETILVCILYSLILVFQAAELIQYWFQAKYLSKYVSVISLCAYVVVSGYKIFLLATGKSIYWFAVSNALDYMLISAALVITYHKLGGGRLRFSWKTARRMLSQSRYYIISSMMVTVFAQTDKIMLKLMVDEAATGYYSAAVACAGMTSFVFSAIIDSARPAIFEAKKEKKEKFEKSISTLYCVIIYLSLAQSVAMVALAKPIILILYGEQYVPAVDALRIVVWYTTFSYMGSVRNIWILAEGKQKCLWIINLSGASMNIVLNALMIPYWGIRGAAAASLITQFFTNFILGFMLKPIRQNNTMVLKGLSPFTVLQFFKTGRDRNERIDY